jgi:hypothetical protein
MLNLLKIKLRSALLLSRKPKPSTEFVNPYAPIAPVPTSKINPYITEYGATKKQSVGALISGAFHKDETPRLKEIVVKEPTFIQDMNEMFIRDIMSVASLFKSQIKKKEKSMTASEIQKACENTKWQ